jgi:acetate kinase
MMTSLGLFVCFVFANTSCRGAQLFVDTDQPAVSSYQIRESAAWDEFHHDVRLRLGIGAMAAVMDGMDALVFTAGIGEHSVMVREHVCSKLGFLGIELDAGLNRDCRPDMDISHEDARARVLVIHTREDISIAREVERVLGSQLPERFS